MSSLHHTSTHTATRKVARAATLLTRAERHLSAVGNSANNPHDRKRFDALARDVRRLVRPLQSMCSILEGGCD